MKEGYLKRVKHTKYLFASLLSIIIISFVYYISRQNENILHGLKMIITSPSILITDFLVIGGLGAAFLNAFLIFLFNFVLIRLLKIKVTGLVIASFFTVFGFSFFGKNIFNILPFYLGGILYSYYDDVDFKDCFVSISFSSALAPFVSEVAFTVNSHESSFINAIILGVIIGFIVVPLSKKMIGFHEGFNLYNLGFTAGILGAVITSILKLYDFDIIPQSLISTQYDTVLRYLCSAVFASMILIGFFINDLSFKGYSKLLKDTGLKADYIEKYGYGLTAINMGIMGFISMAFVYISGETLNGPLLAGILTVVGFSAYGKHFINTIPILLGVFLAKFGTDTSRFTIALSGLFGTALAPVSGVYGPIWGVIAGWLHLAVVQSIGIVHGGLNLYNNGFSAGIVAGFLLPLMRSISEHRNKSHLKFLQKRKMLYDVLHKEQEKRYNNKEEGAEKNKNEN